MAKDSSESHRVVLTPSGLTGRFVSGSTVLDAARQLGVDLDSVCGGRGICGRCQIEPSYGSFAKWSIESTAADLTPWGPLERAYRGKRPIRAGRRLGCGTRLLGDVIVDIPADSQMHRQVIRKDVDVGDLVVDPIYTLHYVEDASDVASALARGWDMPDIDATGLQATSGPATIAVDRGRRAAAVWPGFVDQIVGIAVDIGSTTIAGHLCDLATGEVLASSGRMNPQIRFGEDLMSRVSYVMMNPGGDDELTNAVRQALDEMFGELVHEAGIDRSAVLDIVLVGNPIMHHLVLGIDPTPLGQAPFPLATDGAVSCTATELNLDCQNASVYVAPCIAGHVGADTAAAILSEGPHRGDAQQLLVDVGTNAEIVLGNSEQLFAASSPTGPAFEGAQISSGQRAAAGAIERVRIDRQSYEPRFRVIGAAEWSNDANFEAATAKTGVTGICGSGIIEVISELVSSGIIDEQGVIRGELSSETARVVSNDRTFSYVLHGDIHVTQADVRAIQLAKAALKAGIDLLLEHAELSSPDEIRLAGAFGTHIDPAHAMVLGLIPDLALRAVSAVGNSAGTGAVRALLSAEQRLDMEAAARDVIKIETAIEPRFQELFVTALAFPHSTAPSTASSGGRRRRSASRLATSQETQESPK